MKRISIILLVFLLALLLCDTKVYSQFMLENWKTYSSLLDVTTATVDSRGRIWAGTNGGVFVYDPAIDSVTKEFRNIKALLSLQTTVVRFNPFNKSVYVGSFDGYLDIATEDFNWLNITDIISSDFTKKKISDIVFSDSIAFIGGDFGLSLFNTKQNVFITTITGFDTNSASNTVNHLLLEDGRIWVTTDKGVSTANINSTLSLKENWKNYTLGPGGPGGAIFSHGTDIYAVATNPDNIDAIYKLDNDSFRLVVKAGQIAEKIVSFGLYKGQVMYTSSFGLFLLLDHSRIFGNGFSFHGSIPLSDSSDTYVGFFNNNGIGIIQKDTLLRHIIPNSPFSNYFKRMSVDGKGNLWGVADWRSGVPVMKMEPSGRWKNFTTDKYPDIDEFDFHLISNTSDGKAVVSRWGNGFLVIDDNKPQTEINFYDNTNSPATCADIGNSNFIVMGDSRMDSKGNLWIVNFGDLQSCSGPILLAQTPDGRFYSFDNCINKDNRKFMYLAIDDNGTKWLGSTGEAGLYYFNDNGTLDDPSDDVCGIVNTSNSNIQSNSQNVVTVDKTGVVGVGSSTGLAFIPFPSSALRKTKIGVQKPIIRILQSTPINDIMVDALNNKWIATNNGVWVISPDWMDSLAYIVNTKDTPLINNEITSLATDPATGKIYMGSKYGMSEVTSLSIQPRQAFDIKCYPQPFNPNTDDYLTIDGLAPDAKVNILTINGEPVRALSTTGRKLTWDGNDDKGNKITSGVYMIVASSSSTGGTSVAKFAVVRK